MAVIAEPVAAQVKRGSLWTRAFESRNFLGAMFMVPAIAILVLFLAYPLALGFWLDQPYPSLELGPGSPGSAGPPGELPLAG